MGERKDRLGRSRWPRPMFAIETTRWQPQVLRVSLTLRTDSLRHQVSNQISHRLFIECFIKTFRHQR